jgi:hypothetical protein
MEGELGRMLYLAVVVYVKYYPGICPEGRKQEESELQDSVSRPVFEPE